MRRTCLLAAAVTMLLPSLARADWIVGARSGVAIPFGDESTGTGMSDLVSAQIPFQLDLGYRVQRLTVGGYASYGFGSVSGQMKDACDRASQHCSSTSLRIGGQISYAFIAPPRHWEPWIGAGIGYESITLKRFTESTVSGSEWLIVQGGLDWRFAGGASIGAFASLSFGMYTDVNGGGQSGVIVDRRMHEWLTIGVRGTFAFGR